jgi:signal transduction histidine kinase
VSSLENYGGDLSLALGAWRERMESQVRAASIRLKWNVSDIPVLDWLNPAHVLDILRILQEAVANAVQHSGAATIEVDCHIVAEHIRITVVDNGHGCQSIERMNGKGLVNMRTRANRLGAALEIQSTSEGTRVVLLLSLADAGRAIPPEAAQQA